MNLGNLGKLKFGGAINSQFETSIALERIAIASGEKVGGFTSFLATIEFIGHILTILLSLFIISAYIIIYTVIGLCHLYKLIRKPYLTKKAHERAKAQGIPFTDEEVDKALAKFELTEEEEQEIINSH